jgi:DNA-binding NtrC family response regulator
LDGREQIMPRVLLVDDEKNVLKTLSIGLRRLSYGVEEALTGPEALKVLEKQDVDVVVSDIRMSPMDGYTLASEIHRRYPQIPVILMSAYGFENQQVEEKDGIFYPKLTKPFSVHQLVEKLHEVESAWKIGPAKKNRRLLVFCASEILHQIEKHLKAASIKLVGTDSREKFLKHLSDKQIDCILIDEQMLHDSQWKVLNDLDSVAPQKTVILLVDSPQGRQHTVDDLNVVMVDRKTFFKDSQWIEKYC